MQRERDDESNAARCYGECNEQESSVGKAILDEYERFETPLTHQVVEDAIHR